MSTLHLPRPRFRSVSNISAEDSKRSATSFSKPSRTDQSYAPQADLNRLISIYGTSGVLSLAKLNADKVPISPEVQALFVDRADRNGSVDMHALANALPSYRAAYDSLSPALRSRFDSSGALVSSAPLSEDEFFDAEDSNDLTVKPHPAAVRIAKRKAMQSISAHEAFADSDPGPSGVVTGGKSPSAPDSFSMADLRVIDGRVFRPA